MNRAMPFAAPGVGGRGGSLPAARRDAARASPTAVTASITNAPTQTQARGFDQSKPAALRAVCKSRKPLTISVTFAKAR